MPLVRLLHGRLPPAPPAPAPSSSRLPRGLDGLLASLAELLAKLERGLRAGAVVSSRKSGGDDRGRGKARVGGGPPGKDPSKRCASKEPRAFRSASRGPCSLAGSKGSSPGPPFAPRCPDFLGPPNALRRPLPAPGVPSDPDRLASPFLRPNLALPESESLNFSSRRLAFSPNRSMPADLGPAAPSLPGTLQCFGQRPGSGSPGLGFLGCKPLTGAQRAAQVPGARDPEACPSERVRARLARPTVAAVLLRSVHASARATARRPDPARPPGSHSHRPNFSKLLSAWPDLLSGKGGARCAPRVEVSAQGFPAHRKKRTVGAAFEVEGCRQDVKGQGADWAAASTKLRIY